MTTTAPSSAAATSKPTPSVGYFFCNHYIRGILSAPQAVHAAVEMALDYPPGTPGHEVFRDWGRSGEPYAILLNGGNMAALERIFAAIKIINAENNEGTQLPCGRFFEGIEDLNGALTCVGVVIPSKWMTRKFSVSPEELASVLEQGAAPEMAARLTHWPMADRLLLLRHGLSLQL